MSSEKTMGKTMDCICPCCEREHRAKLFWTGKGKPRVMCCQCKKNSREHATRECCNSLHNGMSKPRAAAL